MRTIKEKSFFENENQNIIKSFLKKDLRKNKSLAVCPICSNIKPKSMIFRDRSFTKCCESCYMDRTAEERKGRGNIKPVK